MERDNEEIVSHVRKKTKELTIQHNNDKKIDKSMLKAEAQRQGEELQYDVPTDFLNESPEFFLKEELSEKSWETNLPKFIND
jgi:hypothetical protein